MLTLFCCGNFILMVDVLMGWLVKQSVDYGRMVEILVQRAASADEFTRLTSITWVSLPSFFAVLGMSLLNPNCK